MRFNSQLWSLPAPVLLLLAQHSLASQSSQHDAQTPAQWLRNLPAHLRSWPEYLLHRRRDIEIVEEDLQTSRSPVGVMKMSPEEGEKFYWEYWQYEGGSPQKNVLNMALSTRDKEDEATLLANISLPYRAPFARHTNRESSYEDLKARKVLGGRNLAAALAMLEKRNFVCPTGTASCQGVGYPNSCCSTTETCFAIRDTGLGPVGCCPNGSSCGGAITTCAASDTPCADSLGGGCCIPGFVCAGVGCVSNPTVVTTTITQVFTVSVISSSTHLSTSIVVVTTTSSSSTSFSSSSTASSQQASSTTSTTSIASPSTATGVAPYRPTGTSTSTTTATETSCPTGFYACSAYYQGGCCRTGRNCDTTSCPAVESTTILSSGVTVVVPVDSAATVATPTGVCATGWSSCAASIGGNCCPSGWSCGTASCSTVSGTATAVDQKASPNLGATYRAGGHLGTVVVIAAFCLGMFMR